MFSKVTWGYNEILKKWIKIVHMIIHFSIKTRSYLQHYERI